MITWMDNKLLVEFPVKNLTLVKASLYYFHIPQINY